MENSLRLAEELGLLDAPAEQIVDSTPMLGAAATQDTVRLVRYGVKRLIDAVAAVDAQAGETLADGLEFDYENPGEKPDCRWRIEVGAGADADAGCAGRRAGAARGRAD